MTKAAKIIITVASIITVIAIIFGVYFNVFRGRNLNFSTSTKQVEETLSFNGEVSVLDMNVDSANITIQKGDKFSVYYNLPEALKPRVELNNGTLRIISTNNGFALFSLPGALGGQHEIRVTLPANTSLKSGRVEVDAGDVNINAVDAENYTFEIDTGNLNLESILSNKIMMEVDAGNVNLYHSKTDELQAELDAGNLDMDSSEIFSIRAEVDAGNIEAHNCTISSGTCDTDVGNVSLDGEIGDVRAHSDIGNVSIN